VAEKAPSTWSMVTDDVVFFNERCFYIWSIPYFLWSIRFSQNFWADPNVVFNAFPGAGHANLPLAFVSVMTFILIISSVTMVLAVHAGHNQDKNGVMKWIAWTIVGGLAFLGCQAWEWHHLITGEHAVLADGKID